MNKLTNAGAPAPENAPRTAHRRGIALVTVLGMLSLLVVLAVAFAVAMRTERVAGRSYMNTTQARHLGQAALAEAIQAIDDTVSSNFYLGVPLTITNDPSASNLPAPNLLSGTATTYVPASFATITNAINGASGWRKVVDYSASSAGFVAFIVLDFSDLLDANVVGGQARASGTNAHEIALDPSLLVDCPNLLAARALANRFETTAELRQPWALGANSRNFTTYSRCPPFIRDFTATTDCDLVMLDTDADALAAHHNEIVSNFTACGIVEAEFAFTNLLCYVDYTNDVPYGGVGVNNAYVKAVPMLNEFFCSNVVKGAAGAWTNEITVMYETWYPFPSLPTFTSYAISLTGPHTFLYSTLPALAPNWTAPVLVSSNPAFTVSAPNSFNLSSFTYIQTSTATNTDVATRTVRITTCRMPAGGVYVSNTVTRSLVDFTPMQLAPNSSWINGTRGGNSVGANDPRYNYLPIWKPNAARTPGTLNNGIMSAEGTTMFARSTASGPLVSAAELGFLNYAAAQSNEWRTIKLYDDGDPTWIMHPVLDYFGVSAQTNTVAGLVNLNAQSTNILASAFMSLPLQEYPGGPAVGQLTAGDAQAIAAQLRALTSISSGTNSLAVIGQAMSSFPTLSSYDDCAKDSLVANSHRLLHPRQQLFAVFLSGLVWGSNDALAEQRAVALVWRDPYPDASNRHPYRVRFFKWLEE